MITSLVFKSSSGTARISDGTLQLDYSSSQLETTTGDTSYTIALAGSVVNRTPTRSQVPDIKGVYTINNIEPFQWNGQFTIYGSACTSVVQHTDTSDPLSVPSNTHELVIFDGCYPCPICKDLAWIQNQIQNCQIWLQGMKDANLYYQGQAAQLWSARYQSKLSNQNPVQCFVRPTSIALDRSSIFGKAIKLFYQYRQAVAMWNFLVRTKSAHVQIVSAPQDFSGFIVQTKISIDTCGGSPQPITLQIDAILESGQCDVDSSQSGGYLQKNNLGMGFYADKTQQNTYIQYGKDSGIHGKQDQGEDIQVSGISVSQQQDGGIKVSSAFTFTPSSAAKTILSAAFKVLPVIYIKGHTYQSQDQQGQAISHTSPGQPISKLTLSQWITQRADAINITSQSHQLANRWHMCIKWQGSVGSGKDLQQNLYFSTAFGKYPIADESDSQSGSGSTEE